MSKKKVVNKSEFLSELAERTGFTKKDLATVLAAEETVFTDILANGDSLKLIGFGTFEVRDRAARKGRNPQTGEDIQIPAGKVPAFKPGKALKDAVK